MVYPDISVRKCKGRFVSLEAKLDAGFELWRRQSQVQYREFQLVESVLKILVEGWCLPTQLTQDQGPSGLRQSESTVPCMTKKTPQQTAARVMHNEIHNRFFYEYYT